MALSCSQVPNYDTRSCCEECHDGKDTTAYEVMVQRKYIRVCHKAQQYAKKNRLIVSTSKNVDPTRKSEPIADKIPAIVLNHKV